MIEIIWLNAQIYEEMSDLLGKQVNKKQSGIHVYMHGGHASPQKVCNKNKEYNKHFGSMILHTMKVYSFN